MFILALKECLDHNTNDTIFFEGKKRDSVHSGGAITRIIFDQGNTEYFRDGAFRMKLCLYVSLDSHMKIYSFSFMSGVTFHYLKLSKPKTTKKNLCMKICKFFSLVKNGKLISHYVGT